MIRFEDARKIVLRHVLRRSAGGMRLDHGHNRVLAEDIHAAADGPEFDKSVMDGFAVRSSDVRKPPSVLKIVEFIPAGKRSLRRIENGECAKIATGACLPRGADAVVIKEDACLLSNGRVEVLRSARRSENIYRRGCDFKKGDRLIKKGSCLNTARVALLSSQGLTKVKVYKAPTVAIISTGDELAQPGRPKQANQIWNSTNAMLVYALKAMNINAVSLGIVRDQERILKKKIEAGLKYDLLIMTGAVSAGERDLVPDVLRKLGVKPLFHKVKIRPGKPLLFALKRSCLIFGLPGNPVSSLMNFLLFVKPAIQRMTGQDVPLIFEEGILSKGVYNKSGRMSFLPAQLKEDKNSKIVVPIAFSGSADLLAVSGADVFFILGDRETKKNRHSRVKFLRIIG